MKKLTSIILAVAVLVSVSVVTAGADTSQNTIFAQISAPSGILQTATTTFLVTDVHNKVVWSVATGKAPVLFSGKISAAGASGEPLGGYKDGKKADALFAEPWAIAPWRDGYLVSDSANNSLRYIAKNGEVQTAVNKDLSNPTGLASDGKGGVYIADTNNDRILHIDADAKVTKVVGKGAAVAAAFNGPTGLAYKDGVLYIADTGNHRIRKFADDKITTIAGVTYNEEEVVGFLDGTVAKARFSNPTGVAVDTNGVIYISDTGNGAVRKLTSGSVTTVTESAADSVYPVSPRGIITSRSGDVLVCDTFSGVVFTPTVATAWSLNSLVRLYTAPLSAIKTMLRVFRATHLLTF
ncbi:MAG: hypothetical protein LBN40_04140 [Oscillospiraceae bacterium]|jgi:sugar lactone lactonase YvrE|nr:hypothetical protein [Oscillospiraceae bacterium]